MNSEPAQDKALGVAQCDKQNGESKRSLLGGYLKAQLREGGASTITEAISPY